MRKPKAGGKSKVSTGSASRSATTKARAPKDADKKPEISFGRTGKIDFGVDTTKPRKPPRR